MTCNATRSGFSLFRNCDNAGVLQIYLMTFGTKGYRIYIHILFFAVIVIGYNILFGGLDMDRI
jgi:hypothetical protein